MSAFRVGDWLVEPTLNSLSRPDSTVRLEPKVMQVFDLASARDAFEAGLRGHVHGKLVLRVARPHVRPGR